MATKKEDTSILADDVDDTSDPLPMPHSDDDEDFEPNVTMGETVPVPEDSGKSFTALIATFVAGAVLSFATAKGWLTNAQSDQFTPLLQGFIVAGVAWVTTRFLKSRSEVKVEALRANAVARGMAMSAAMSAPAGAAGPLGAAGPMGGFNLGQLLTVLTTAQLATNFIPGDAKKKEKVNKALTAATAALNAFHKNPH